MARASLELCLGSLDSFRGAGGDNVLIELGQDDGAGSERAGQSASMASPFIAAVMAYL